MTDKEININELEKVEGGTSLPIEFGGQLPVQKATPANTRPMNGKPQTPVKAFGFIDEQE